MRLPFQRLFGELALGMIDIMAPITQEQALQHGLRIPQRSEKVATDLAVTKASASLAILRERKGELEDTWTATRTPKGSVGVVRGSHLLTYAKEQKWQIATVQSIEKGLAMLALGRLTHMLAVSESLEITEPVQSGSVVLLNPPVTLLNYFYAVRPAFAEQHERFVVAFWEAACKASMQRRDDRPTCRL
jgi:hypothetical protein